MQPPILKWKEPHAAALQGWFWSLPAARRPATLFYRVQGILLLLLLALTFVNHLLQWDYRPFLFFWLPVAITWSFHRALTTYALSEDGLRLVNGLSRKHYRWHEVEWYVVEPAYGAPGVSLLRFKARKAGKEQFALFYFDPKATDEQRLREILDHYLPSKNLRT